MKQFFLFFLAFLLVAPATGQELKRKENASGKWGFIDVHGNTMIPFLYDYVGAFSEGLASVQLNGK